MIFGAGYSSQGTIVDVSVSRGSYSTSSSSISSMTCSLSCKRIFDRRSPVTECSDASLTGHLMASILNRMYPRKNSSPTKICFRYAAKLMWVVALKYRTSPSSNSSTIIERLLRAIPVTTRHSFQVLQPPFSYGLLWLVAEKVPMANRIFYDE